MSPYNGIIGRPGLKAIQAVPSTVHGMLKFPVEEGIATIRSTILISTECASVTTSSVIPREEKTCPANFTAALHLDLPNQEVVIGGSLSDKGRTEAPTQHPGRILTGAAKKRGQAPKRAKAIQAEVQKLVEAGIMREVYYHDWLSNPIMVKKHDGSWRMCVDFTDLNKAYPQDCYPFTEIDWKVESLCGYPFKCFLDAYKGYHQIQLAEADEEKTAFHTGQGVYCYTKMPFGLKNTGATYQRLMDKAFKGQVGRNIKVYVDDLVVKIHTEAEMVRDIEETFSTLRKVNMKLNPKKCSFGLAEGVFLGLRRYFQAHPIVVITDQPIKQRPDVAGRLQKWSIMLGEHNITYRPRTSIKGQILVYFLIEMPGDASQAGPATVTQEEQWTLFTDGLSCVDGSAEYEALVVGLRIATQMGVKNVQVNVDSKLVLVEVLENKSIRGKKVTAVIEEEGITWMTQLVDYLKEGILPEDEKEARKLRLKARQYELMERVLNRRSFLTPWLRCVGPLQADYSLTPITDLWPFYKWGIEIAGPFSEGPGKVKFLIVSMDYFTKWIEAKAVATITGGQAHRTMIKSSHGDTPFSLTYGTEAVIPTKIRMPTYRTVAVNVVNNDEELHLNLDLLEERRECAAVCEAKSKSKMMKYYNARVHGVAFRPGDFVYRSNDASHAVTGGKLGPKWEGPYEVIEALGNGAYKLRSTDGTILPRTWNVANLK
uniref:Reverse transcriptase domain-containing protein n=1 Tax=Tanacetum cinerariifolium TaxID=118510 RepID=A0A6L2M6N0_TANCI|nr:reverse transcriptase domain-containing protein [Tanacetum cinerariifolium]